MVVQIVSGLIVLVVAVLVLIPLIRYRITHHWLLITLFGIPIRWVSLKNIRYVTDHAKEFAESWPNTHSPKARILFIRKRRGLFRTLKITPLKRFVFKAELEKAIRALDPDASFDDTQFFDHKPADTTLKHRHAQ
ncbi:hypothetical protein GC207_11915 [bacterium]|nr:hypothetical protein [bacterium]